MGDGTSVDKVRFFFGSVIAPLTFLAPAKDSILLCPVCEKGMNNRVRQHSKLLAHSSDSLVFHSTQGENARLSSFVGAIAIADLVKTTLGPKGMDKILQSVSPDNQGIQVTNDGATILKSVYLDNAAAKVLVDIAKVQDDEVGDGTTSVAVLCGELL